MTVAIAPCTATDGDMIVGLFFHFLVLHDFISSARRSPRSCLTRLWTKTGAVETSAVVKDDGTSKTRNAHPRPTEISSPRHWLESEPDGVYTVLRCDRVWGQDALDDWIVWGEEFHCSRLCESYRSIFRPSNPDTAEPLLPALQQRAKTVLRQLLDYSAKVWSTEWSMIGQVYVLTILAHPPVGDDDASSAPPIIQGHVSLGPLISHPLIPLVRDGIEMAIVRLDDESFPNRLADPLAKRSEWCRKRRAIEAAVRASSHEVAMVEGGRLLEGLTSNIFVVDDAGMIQTAPTNKVLNGYVRHCLVTQLVRPETKIQAPALDDCADWRRVFITSSIRLVVPVSCIVDPIVSDAVVWKQPFVDTETTASMTEALYQNLVLDRYTESGYGHLCV